MYFCNYYEIQLSEIDEIIKSIEEYSGSLFDQNSIQTNEDTKDDEFNKKNLENSLSHENCNVIEETSKESDNVDSNNTNI